MTENNTAKNSTLSVDDVRAMVKAGDIKPDDYIAAFKKDQGRVPNLSEDALFTCIGALEDDDMDEFIRIALVAEAEAMPDVENVEATAARIVSVHRMAETLAKNTQLMADVDAFVTAPEDMKKRPALGCKHAMDDANFDMDTLPRPGSKRIEGSNQPYDLYLHPVAGKDEPQEGSYFDRLAEATPKGKENLTELNRLTDMKARKDETIPLVQLDSKIAMYKARLKAAGNFWRKVSGIYYMLADIQEHFADVRCGFQLDGSDFRTVKNEDGTERKEKVPQSERNLIETPYPFWIQDINNPVSSRKLSMSDLLRFDIAKAKAALPTHKNNGYQALTATSKKAKKGTGKGGADKTSGAGTNESKQPMLTIGDVPDWISRGANFADEQDPSFDERLNGVALAAAKWDQHAVLSFYAVRNFMDRVEARAGLGPKYTAIVAKIGAENATKAKEDAAKIAALHNGNKKTGT